ncbi:hypothetical protein NL676_014281 [Syzygium grande]|nr:hypothetical protein NL676_014281 [Syzygium grande]
MPILHSTTTVHGVHPVQSVGQTPVALLLRWPLLPKSPAALVGALPNHPPASKIEVQAKLRARAAMAAASFELEWSWRPRASKQLEGRASKLAGGRKPPRPL